MTSSSPRQRLPHRRASESFDFGWAGMLFTATISRFADCSLAEIFLTSRKAGSQADIAARDSAVVASLALQHGLPLETLYRAVLRDAQGVASGPLGIALDLANRSQA
jgi:hypothetical protein